MSMSFFPQRPKHSVLPHWVKQEFVSSPGGELELLSAIPTTATKDAHGQSPLFLVHGGFGCAAVWIDFMSVLSQAPYNIPCYAISLRGHGMSWYPGYWRMVFGTTKRALADDIESGIRHVERVERERQKLASDQRLELTLVAHSNGGGLSQLALHDGRVRVNRLALLCATPCFGLCVVSQLLADCRSGVYWNWFQLDPWFSLRLWLHLGHPNSPVSSPRLIKQVFFSQQTPHDQVLEFESRMSPYEALMWPMSMFQRFVNVTKILGNITGVENRPKVLILAAEQDKIMTPSLMQRAAAEYRAASQSSDGSAAEKDIKLFGVDRDVADGVEYAVVPKAGHQVMNDVWWNEGAELLGRFYAAK